MNDSFKDDFSLQVRTVARTDAYLAIQDQEDGVHFQNVEAEFSDGMEEPPQISW